MIIRKMRNNVMKKIPKDFGNPVAAQEYRQLDDVVYQQVIEEISENANAQEFPIVPEREYQQGIEQKEVQDVYKRQVLFSASGTLLALICGGIIVV